MKKIKLNETLRYENGATLIEVLIAAIVVSMGLLSIAALQINALQGATDARYRSAATDIAWAMADRMRANLRGFSDNNYGSSDAINCSTAPKSCAMTPGGTALAESSNCTTAEIAADDLYKICTLAADTLPGGLVIVSCGGGCSDGSSATITVSWATREQYDQGDWDGDLDLYEDHLAMTVIPGSETTARIGI